MAILSALELTLESSWPSITIFTDSMSVLSAIKALFNPRRSSYLILRIKSLLYQLSIAGSSVNLIWIPSLVAFLAMKLLMLWLRMPFA